MAETALTPQRPVEGRSPHGRPGRSAPALLLRWLPAVSVTAFTAGVALFYGVSVRDLGLFAVYLAVCVALPGTLLVRALYRGRRTLAEEIALGVALGYAVEVVVYAAARAAGAPLLVLAWPVATFAAVAVVPRLRGRGSRALRTPAPVWWSWALALTVASLVAWSAVTFFRHTALTWPEMASANVDLPYHLALIGELKHHMPPATPMVAGEPLLYHWFVYAHYAAASWITGVEPLVLLFRLGMLPVLAALVVLLGMVARRGAGSRAGALAAVAGTFYVVAPSLYLGPSTGVFTWKAESWTSPSQTFGALLFAPVVLLAADLLEGRGGAGRWTMLGVFLVGVMGAKATQLPLLAAGLATAGAVGVVRRRRVSPALLALAAMTGVCLLFAQFVLFGGARNGIVVDPLSLVRVTWGELTGRGDARPGTASLLGVAALYAVCWALIWFGVLGLLAGRPGTRTPPGVLLMLGMGGSGLGAVLLLGHCQMSQIYFLAGSYPYLMVVAARGLSAARARARLPYRTAGVAVAAGVLIEVLVRWLCGVRVPLEPGRPEALLYLPYGVLALVVALVVGVLALRGWRGVRLWACTVFLVGALGLPAAWVTRALPNGGAVPGGAGEDAAEAGVSGGTVPEGTVAAARWLRAHSSPDDLVATDAHCRWGHESPCDSRHFWLAALAERRVLVEGWTYTSANMARWRPGVRVQDIPFRDQRLLRDNDAAVRDPASPAGRLLRDRYGVRWLVSERRPGDPEAPAGATPAYRSGDYAVYRLR
ncbi:hypothetical protein ACIBI0_23320 [Microbispora rosea]|uniref:hypothetical protein n=1 Tax=Microbispora rosea TaxID=58117 RepID=UPI003798C564